VLPITVIYRRGKPQGAERRPHRWGSGLGDTVEGFLLEKGALHQDRHPRATTETVPFGVNDRRQVVGGSTRADGTGQGHQLLGRLAPVLAGEHTFG
jgi:hypothetical protein